MARREITGNWTRDDRITINENFRRLFEEYTGAGLDAKEAREKAHDAVMKSDEALALSERTQKELSQAILEGDSSPLGGQLSVGADGTIYSDPQDRLVKEFNSVNQQLAHIENDRLKFVNYEMFTAPYANDGERIKAAHLFANDNNLPVINPVGDYYIGEVRYIPVMTNFELGFTNFHIDETKNTRDPIFHIKSTRERMTLNSDEKSLLLTQIKPSTKRIVGLEQYRNCILVAKDNSIPVIRRDGGSGQTHYLTEFFFVDSDGGVHGDIYYDLEKMGSTEIGECYAYPVDDDYLTVSGGNFILSGNNDANYAKVGFLISRSRVIIDKPSVRLSENDIATEPREGFYVTDHIYDLTYQNVKGLSFKSVDQGTYFFRDEFAIKVRYDNVDVPHEVGDWGCHVGYYTKDISFYRCHMNRVDSHFFGMDYNVVSSKIGVIRYQGAGKLYAENTTVYLGDNFLAGRGDYASIFDGEIHLKDCKLIVNENSSNTLSIIRHDANSMFDFIAQSILAKSIKIENFTFVSTDGNENKRYIVIRRMDVASHTGGTQAKKGMLMPDRMEIDGIHVDGRENGVEFMDLSNAHVLRARRKHSFNEAKQELIANAEIKINNVKGLKLTPTNPNLPGERTFLFMTGIPADYDEYSYVPDITLSKCDHTTIHTGGSRSNLLTEHSEVRVLDAHAQTSGQQWHHGKMKFLHTRFAPLLKEGSYSKGTQINMFGSSSFLKFIDSCTFEPPKILRTDGSIVEVEAAFGDYGLNQSSLRFNNSRLKAGIDADSTQLQRLLIPEV